MKIEDRKFQIYSGVLPSTYCLLTVLFVFCGSVPLASAQTSKPEPKAAESIGYQIRLALDFENRTYAGDETVRWVNRGDHPTATLFFHLYPNMRAPGYTASTLKNDAGQTIPDEPRLEVSEVRVASTKAVVSFTLDDQETTLRVNLHEPVQPNQAVELHIKFKGSVPEIDPDETGLVTHVLQQVSAAIRGTREMRRARDTNFVCRGVMMLTTSFPILAARSGEDWYRRLDASIGDALTTDVADYDVTIEVDKGVSVFTPVIASSASAKTEVAANHFAGNGLRDFAIIAGRNLRIEQSSVDGVMVRSIFRADHEAVGKRVLKIACDAVRIYDQRFGSLPLNGITIVDVPLVATLGSVECSGLAAIAGAFYVDFESPSMRNMPDVIQEQRASVEDSLEWTVAHVVAHQWWGTAVGNDAAREPVLDESLSNWSAFLYYHEAHGPDRAAMALEEQLRGVYKLYRTFGGEDMEASRASRDYRNSFQYAAIVSSKGALMFEALRKLMGDEKFFEALRAYYKANAAEVADLDDLRGAFIAEAPVEQRRTVSRTFDRWLSSKRGDEDIGPPDPKLAQELGIPVKANAKDDKNVFTGFAKVGKFFWQQMTKIR